MAEKKVNTGDKMIVVDGRRIKMMLCKRHYDMKEFNTVMIISNKSNQILNTK